MPEKLTRQEMKVKKQTNRSLTSSGKAFRTTLGVVSVQEKDFVYFCGDNTYRKIYTVKPALLEDRSGMLAELLVSTFSNRMRLTYSLKSSGSSLNGFLFLTVSFSAECYYDAKKVIADFEKKLRTEVSLFLHVEIEPCSVENAMMFMNMSLTGKMAGAGINPNKPFLPAFDLSEKRNPKLFQDSGFFRAAGRYVMTYTGRVYSEEILNPSDYFRKNRGSYLVCIDFERFNEDDAVLCADYFKSAYHLSNYSDSASLSDLTYIVTGAFQTEEERSESAEILTHDIPKDGILMMPCPGREIEIFKSICSFGLSDFHSGIAVDTGILNKLLL